MRSIFRRGVAGAKGPVIPFAVLDSCGLGCGRISPSQVAREGIDLAEVSLSVGTTFGVLNWTPDLLPRAEALLPRVGLGRPYTLNRLGAGRAGGRRGPPTGDEASGSRPTCLATCQAPGHHRRNPPSGRSTGRASGADRSQRKWPRAHRGGQWPGVSRHPADPPNTEGKAGSGPGGLLRNRHHRE